MKPSAPLTIRHSIRLAIVGVLLAVWSFAALAAQSAYHFDLSQYRGASLTYYLVSTGTLEVADESRPPVTISLEISSPLDISFSEETADGELGFVLVMQEPVVRGLDESGRRIYDPLTLRGRLGPGGVLREIETPQFLTDLGLDMTDLIVGLVVPAPVPHRAITPGVEWRATFSRGTIVDESPRSLNLAATYTVGRPVDWGNRTLQSVTARLRADATWRTGSMRTEVQEIGHALFYLKENGVPELSSVSVVTQIETRQPTARTPLSRSKVTLTTTLELRQFSPYVPAGEKEDEPVGPVPGVAGTPQEPVDVRPVSDAVSEPEPSELLSATGVAPQEHVHAPLAPAGDPVTDPAIDPIIETSPAPSGEDTPGYDRHPIEAEAPSAAGPADEPAASQDGEPEEKSEAEPELEPQPEPEPEPRPEPVILPPTVYRDPAGRFELGLGDEWVTTPHSISLRGTTFTTKDGGERAYVYVMPLPSPAATALAIARSALATYGETQSSFRVLLEPEEDSLDGEIAYRAKYTYTLDGERITEWALFARMRDRAYYVQYAKVGGAWSADDGLEKLHQLRDHFRFGENPRGSVPVEHLAGNLVPYTDPAGRFRVSVPSLWPRTEVAADGSSTMFTEIGENGYLTILVQPGARGIAPAQIVSSWKEQWAQERGFRVLIDITEHPLAGHAGVRFDYAWSAGASGDWTRRLHAIVVDDTFIAVALEYEAGGYAERMRIFDEIIQSFTLVDESESTPQNAASASDPLALEPAVPPTPADTAPPAGESGTAEPPVSAPAVTAPPAPPEDAPFDEPAGDEGVLLLGRILTRYPGPDGQMEEAWAKNLQVSVVAGQDEFQGVTDDLGYLYVANLPRLTEGRLYTVTRLEGPMLGFVEPVTVSFDNLRIGQIGPRIAHLRTVILTLSPNRSLSVEIVRTAPSAPDDPSALAYFIATYPGSAWAPHVKEAILSGVD